MRAPNIAGEAGVRLVDEISARLSAWSDLIDSLDIVVGMPSDQLAVNKSCATLRHPGVQRVSSFDGNEIECGPGSLGGALVRCGQCCIGCANRGQPNSFRAKLGCRIG